jgi:hypothetical protein
MKRFFKLTLGIVFVFGATYRIFADPLQWDLSTLTFSATSFPAGMVSTGTVTGSFTYDADTNSFTTWNIELSGFLGTGIPVSGLLLTPADTMLATTGFCLSCPRGSFALFESPNPLFNFSALALSFTQPLTDAGGTVPVDGSTNNTVMILDLPTFNSFELQSPGGSASAVPEPSSAALTLLVVIGFGALFLRRLRHYRR